MSSRATGSGQGSRDAGPPVPRSPQPDSPRQGTGPLRRVVAVVNPLGLHQRVADRFCRAAKQYGCAVTVWNGERRADGKNIWDLIGLLVVPGDGSGAGGGRAGRRDRLDPLAAILGAPGGEDYTI